MQLVWDEIKMERGQVMSVLIVVSELFAVILRVMGSHWTVFHEKWQNQIWFMISKDHYDACRRIVIIALHVEVEVWITTNYPSIRTKQKLPCVCIQWNTMQLWKGTGRYLCTDIDCEWNAQMSDSVGCLLSLCKKTSRTLKEEIL